MPRANLSTIVVPVPLDAYLHVVMADLTAHDLRLDRLFIYLSMRPVLSNTNRPPTSKRHSTSDATNILYATRYIIPLYTNVVEWACCELRHNGVLGRSAS